MNKNMWHCIHHAIDVLYWHVLFGSPVLWQHGYIEGLLLGFISAEITGHVNFVQNGKMTGT
jgi:hypothetical protein